jgi:hypothetical protein
MKSLAAACILLASSCLPLSAQTAPTPDPSSHKCGSLEALIEAMTNDKVEYHVYRGDALKRATEGYNSIPGDQVEGADSILIAEVGERMLLVFVHGDKVCETLQLVGKARIDAFKKDVLGENV